MMALATGNVVATDSHNSQAVRFEKVWMAACLAILLVWAGPALAQQASEEAARRGAQWLRAQVQADGSLQSENVSVATPEVQRAEALHAISLVGSDPAPPALITAVAENLSVEIEHVARALPALARANAPFSQLHAKLLAAQAESGEFGLYGGAAGTSLDTGLALSALAIAAEANAAYAMQAIAALASAASNSGSFTVSSEESVYVTCQALIGLQAWRDRFNVSSVVEPAAAWLLAQRSAGVFGSTLENAEALLALRGLTLDPTVFAPLSTALRSTQDQNGSWSNDPFLTARVVRALWSDGLPTPPPMTGSIQGSLANASTLLPVAGATLRLLSGPEVFATSRADGHFELRGVRPGENSLTISAFGYANRTVPVIATAGSVVELGRILLSPASLYATLSGVVSDEGGQPIANATVAVGTATAATSEIGVYMIDEISAGSAVITVIAPGYQTLNQPLSFEGGIAYIFSPSLVIEGSPNPQATDLIGRVVDAASHAPIANAAVSTASRSTTTDADGLFVLTQLDAGHVLVELTASAYVAQGYNVTLAQGRNDAGDLELSPRATSTSLSGRVLDFDSGMPVAAAAVSVVGTTLSATTNSDGAYSISGILNSSFQLSASATGYTTSRFDVSLPEHGDAQIDLRLARESIESGVSFREIRTNKPEFAPYDEFEVEIEVHNGSGTPTELVIDVQVIDAEGRLAFQLKANARGGGPNPPNLPVAIPGNTIVEVELERILLRQPAGIYTLRARGVDNLGRIVAQGTASFTVRSESQLGGGLVVDPPVAQAGTETPIHFSAELTNLGNETLGAGPYELVVTLQNADPRNLPQPAAVISTLFNGPPLKRPLGMVSGEGDSVYLVNKESSQILRVGLDGTLDTAGLLPGLGYVDLARAADGTFWASDYSNVLTRLSPGGTVTAFESTTVDRVVGIALAPDGDLLLAGTSSTGESRLARRNLITGTDTLLASSGLAMPSGIARKPDGSYLVTNYGDNTVAEVSATGQVRPFLADFDRPSGIALGGNDSIYVSNSGNGTIERITASGARAVLAENLEYPGDLVVDDVGNLFVALPTGSSILRIAVDGSVSTYARGLSDTPLAMTEDDQGRLYIANGDGRLTRKSGDAVDVLSMALSAPNGIALDASGAVLVTNPTAGSVQRIDVDGTESAFATGLDNPFGVVRPPQGGVLVTESGANRIARLSDSGAPVEIIETLVSTPDRLRLDAAGRMYAMSDKFVTVRDGGQVRRLVRDAAFRDFIPDGVGGGYGVTSDSVFRISSDGSSTEIGQMPFVFIRGLGIETDGSLLIADGQSNRLMRMDASGVFSEAGQFGATPSDIAQGSNGDIYVLLEQSRVVRLLPGGGTELLLELGYANSLDSSSDGRLLAVGYSGSSYTVRAIDPESGSITELAADLPPPASAVLESSGRLTVSLPGENSLVEFSNGTEVARLDGFFSPGPILWAGSEFRFVAGYQLYAFASGEYPRRLGPFPAQSLFQRGTATWGVQGNQLLRWNGTEADVFAFPEASNLAAAVGRPDGSAVIADQSTSAVFEIDSDNAVINRHAGIVQPSGLDLDANGRLLVANGNGTLARLGAAGSVSTLLASNISGLTDVSVSDGGTIHVTHDRGISTVDPASHQVTLLAEGEFRLGALSAGGATPIAADSHRSQLHALRNGIFETFASGISNLSGLRVAPGGEVLLLSHSNGTVLRFQGGVLEVVVAGLDQPTALTIDAGGGFTVAGADGKLYRSATDGSFTTRSISSLLPSGSSLAGIGARSDGSLVLTEQNYNTLFVVEPGVASLPPAVGTVVHRATRQVPALPATDVIHAIDFGDWTPPYGGDFKAQVSREGTVGQATNFVHVGPFATGDFTVQASRVPPGHQTVPLRLRLTGADFTSISRVETGQFRRLVDTSFPRGMTADRSGNIFFTDEDSIKRVSPSGISTEVLSGISPQFGLAIDADQNLYLPSSRSSDTSIDVLRVAPGGALQILTNLGPVNSNGVAVDSFGRVLIGSYGALLRFDQTSGQMETVSTLGISDPLGIAVDGRDNVYVQNTSHTVSQISPDGRTRSIFDQANGLDQPIFEGDGYPTITADCAENFYITASNWELVGQKGEERVLSQVVPKTGQVVGLLDVSRIDPRIADIDYLSFDRFGNRILMWDHSTGAIYSVPVTCGAISVEAHVLTRSGQMLTGFDRPPAASLAKPDGRTEYVWSLRDVTAEGLALNFDTHLTGLSRGEMRSAVDSAFLLFRNSFVAGDVRVPIAIPKVVVEDRVSMSVTTDAPEYPAGAIARITTTLQNPDAAPASGQLRVTVLDAAGEIVGSLASAGIVVPASGQSTAQGDFPIGSTLPGNYSVRAALMSGLVELARAETSLRVVADVGAASSIAQLQLDRSEYLANDRVQITSRALNQSANVPLANLLLSLRVRNPAGTLLLTSHHQVGQLLPGTRREFMDGLDLASAEPGVYPVELTLADDDGRSLDMRSASFTVLPSSGTGVGLSGSLVAEPAMVDPGMVVGLSASIRNDGNAALIALPVRLAILDLEAQALIVTWNFNVDLARGGQLPLQADWETTGVAPGSYVASLATTVSGQELVLARSDVHVRSPDVSVDLQQSIGADTRVLALRFCKGDGGTQSAPHCQNHPARTFLDQYLTSQGVIHKVVDDVASFRRELRSGRYNTYWLSGHYPLLPGEGAAGTANIAEAQLGREVTEAVFRGEGLILDGRVDWQHSTPTPSLGVRFTTRLSGPDPTVSVADTAVFDPASIAVSGRGLLYESTGAIAHARFGASAVSGPPAIFTNGYGSGRTALFAFDFIDLLQANPSAVSPLDLLNSAMSYAVPTPLSEFSTGAWVPVISSVMNEGPALNLANQVRVPAGVSIEATDPVADETAPGSALWRFPLAMGDSRDFDAALRIVEADGTVTITSTLSRVTGATLTQVSESALDLQIRTYAERLASARTAIAALPVSTPAEIAARAAALANLDQTDDAIAQLRFDDAILHLLNGSERLQAIQSTNVGIARTEVSRLLQIAGYRWFQAQPLP